MRSLTEDERLYFEAKKYGMLEVMYLPSGYFLICKPGRIPWKVFEGRNNRIEVGETLMSACLDWQSRPDEYSPPTQRKSGLGLFPAELSDELKALEMDIEI